jgi:hypothetical protein
MKARGARCRFFALLLLSSAAIGLVPASAQTLVFEPVGSIPGPADWIEVSASTAYVAAGNTLTIFDIATPAAPVRQGSYTFPEKIWGFIVVGPLAYVAADVFGLGILDVSNPSQPTLKGSFKTPGQAKQVALYQTTAFVADHMSGLDIVDVSDTSSPVSAGSFFVEGYARDVSARGPLAIAVDSPTGLYIFDLSTANAFEPVGTLQTPNKDRSSPLHPNLASVANPGGGRLGIAAVVRSESLQLYDIADPTKPISVTNFRTPSGRPQRAALTATHAYVADGTEGLIVVDLSTLSSPKVVGSFKTPSAARDVFVLDSLVFVVIGDLRRDSRSPSGTEVLILRQRTAEPSPRG